MGVWAGWGGVITGVDMKGMAGGGGGTDDRWITYLYPARSEWLTGVAGRAKPTPPRQVNKAALQQAGRSKNREKWRKVDNTGKG